VRYDIRFEGYAKTYQENRELIFSLTAGLLLLTGWLGEMFFGFPHLLSVGLYLGAYACGGLDIARHAFHALRERHFDTDLLMVLAAIGAALLGEFAERGAAAVLVQPGARAGRNARWNRARSAIHRPGRSCAKTALVRRNGQAIEARPSKNCSSTKVVIVRPGVRFADRW